MKHRGEATTLVCLGLRFFGPLAVCLSLCACASPPLRKAATERGTPALAQARQLDQEDQLIVASGFGDLMAIRTLIAQGVDVNGRGNGETYALFHAVDSGSPTAVALLLDAGAKTRFPEFGDGTILHMTALGHEGRRIATVLETLIRHGEAIDAIDNAGRTPLHLFALYRRPKWASALVNRGADVNAKDAYGATPADYAAMGAARVKYSGDSASKILIAKAGGVGGSKYDALDLTRCPARWQALVKGMWLLEIDTVIGAKTVPDKTFQERQVGAREYTVHLEGGSLTIDPNQRLAGVRCGPH